MNPAVDFYIERQPLELQPLLHAARHRLLTLDDRIREEWKYGVPMYRYHGIVAYLSTVPRKPYIHIGLAEGVHLSDVGCLLTGHDRKQIRHLQIHRVADADREGVLEILHEALLLDEQRHAAKAGKGKRKRKRSVGQ